MTELPVERAGNVLLQVFRTSHAVGGLLQHAVAGTGVSADEWAVLSVIGVMRTASPSDLADQLRVPPTSISRYVARLTDAGLVRRSPNPSDGRSSILELTEDGRQKVETIAPRFRGIVVELRTQLAVEEIELALLDLERAAKALDLDRSTAKR
jgi:DNA-binding MarR family transcriptional regulator